MLSTRAKNVLTAAGYDLRDIDGTVRMLKVALLGGVKWRGCGRATWNELEEWAATVQKNPVTVKIVQIIVTPDGMPWQNRLIGLGSDGATYWVGDNGYWEPMIPPLGETWATMNRKETPASAEVSGKEG